MIIAPVPPGSILADTDTKLTAKTAAALKALGYAGVIRYVGRLMPQSADDLDATELQAILEAGLGLMVVQHCPLSFTPSAALGTAYGQVAVADAQAAGYLPGGQIWIDFENCLTAVGATAYLNAWCRVVIAGGYFPGLYGGADSPLSGDQLYWDVIATRYWRAGSRDAPMIPYRGICMQQSLSSTAAGINIDRNVVMRDNFGGLPIWNITGN